MTLQHLLNVLVQIAKKLWKFKKKFTVLLLFNGVFSNAEVIGMK
jgi:hypothetical protein